MALTAVFDVAPDWAYARATEVLRTQYEGDRGYNPGSQMVQIVGIAALSPFDHFVKEHLRIKGYVRYMDDFILIHEDLGYLDYCRVAIEEKLAEIELRLHPRKTKIVDIDRKINFLGFDFRLTATGKVVMTLGSDNIRRMRKRITRLARLEADCLRAPGTTRVAYAAWRKHASKGDSYKLLKRYDEWFERLVFEYALEDSHDY